MTDLDLIKRDIDSLGAINVPAAMIEQIGIPILNVRNDLIQLYNSVMEQIRAKREELEAQKAAEEESDEKIVKMAPNDEEEVEEDADVQYSEDSPE